MATNIEADANIGSYRSLNDSDLITNAKANVSIFGGVGNDTIRNSADNVTISGENGNDIINNADALGWGNNLVLNGGDGDDTLMSGTSNVTMIGGSGKDIFDVRFYNKTTASSIVIDDYNSNEDKLKISVGSLTGGEVLNDDVIFYNKSHKITLKNAKGKAITTVDSKGNENTAVYGSNSTSVPVYDVTYDSKGNAIIKNRSGNEVINSGSGSDTIKNYSHYVKIYGGSGNDNIENKGTFVTIDGGDGNDWIRHRDGFDVTINGGNGDDTVVNENSNVTISGGNGDDTFYLLSGIAYVSGVVISDYEENDKLRFSSSFLESSLDNGDVLVKVDNYKGGVFGIFTLKNAKDKEITVIDGNGKEIKFTNTYDGSNGGGSDGGENNTPDNGNNSTDDGDNNVNGDNNNNSTKNYNGTFTDDFFEVVDSKFTDIAGKTASLVTKLMKKEAKTNSSSSTSDESKLLADFKKYAHSYPTKKFPDDVYEYAMNSIQAVEVEKISTENMVNKIITFISGIFAPKDDGSFTASDGKTYKITPTLSNISELVTIEVDGESYVLSWTGTTAGKTWSSFKDKLMGLAQDACNNVWKELAHDLQSNLTDMWIEALAKGGKKEFSSVIKEMKNYGDIDQIVVEKGISNIEELTNAIFPSNSSKIQTLATKFQNLSNYITTLKNDKNVTVQSESYKDFVRSYNSLAGSIKDYGGGNISKVYDKTFSAYLNEELAKSGNFYTYNGGNANIASYSAGEKINLASDFAGIDFTDTDFKIKSSSGTLKIQNVRDKFIDIAVEGNTIAYAYLSSSEGNLDGSGFSQYEVIIGGNNSANQITAGSGGSSLWGGAGGEDILTGGAGQDNFFYGKNDGADLIQNASSGDIVNLYDVSLADITAATASGNKISVTCNTGNNLQINSAENLSPTFQLADSSRWQFNHSSGNWQRA